MNELLQQKRQIVVCLFTFLFAVVSPGGGSVVEMGGRKQENGITREIQNVLHPNYYVGNKCHYFSDTIYLIIIGYQLFIIRTWKIISCIYFFKFSIGMCC